MDMGILEKKMKKLMEEAEEIDNLEDDEFGEDNDGSGIPEELKTKEGREKKRKELKKKQEEIEKQEIEKQEIEKQEIEKQKQEIQKKIEKIESQKQFVLDHIQKHKEN